MGAVLRVPRQFVLWWETLEVLHKKPGFKPIELRWRPPRGHCGAELSVTESAAFCCGNGESVLPPLELYTAEIRTLIFRDVAAFAGLSRRLNDLLCFTTSLAPVDVSQSRTIAVSLPVPCLLS